MAIQWGSTTANFRLGIDVVSSGGKLTWIVYGQSVNYGYDFWGDLSFGGAWGGGTKRVTFYAPYGETRTVEFYRTTRNPATETNSVSISVPGLPGITASASRKWTLSAPAAPTGASVTRNSDTKMTVKWSNTSPTSTSAPYDGVDVQVWSATSDTWTNFSGGGSLGVVTSAVHNGTAANNRYRFRVRARNSAGASTWAFTSYVYTTPAGPTAISVTRNSDTQMTVGWTLPSRSSATSHLIERWAQSDQTWRQIASVSATATSYVYTGTGPNDRYQFRVRASNDLYSGYVTSDYATTTPAAPGVPSAFRDGLSIELEWQNTDALVITGIQVWHAANGVWDTSPLVTLSGSNPTTWRDDAPDPSKTHTYRLRTRAGGDVSPVLYSADSPQSNVVQLLTNPAAPTGLSPNGSAFDGAQPVTLRWVHNSVDGSRQKAFELQYRLSGAPSWESTGKVTGTSQQWVLPAGTFSNGSTVQWRVRTWGDYAVEPSYSPWSVTATVPLSTPPAAVILTPGDTVDTANVAVTWSYSDDEGHPQVQALVRMYDADMTVIESRSAGPGKYTADLTSRVQNGGTYTVGLTVTDTTGLSSPEVLQTFTVEYAAPPVPTIEVEWDSESGSSVLSIENGEASKFGWSGTEDDSASVKYVNGVEDARNLFPNPRLVSDGTMVEVRRNHCINPRVATGTTGWSTGGSAGARVPVPGLPDGIAHAYEYTNPTASSGMRVVTQITGLTVGTTYHVRALVKVPIVSQYRMRIGETTGATAPTTTGPLVAQAGVYHDYATSFVASASVMYVQIHRIAAGTGPETIGMTGVIVSTDTGPYFDAQFSPDADLTPSSVGTLNASESVLSGRAIRRVTGGYQSHGWDEYENVLRVPAGRTASIVTADAETLVITARNADQTINGVAGVAGENRVTTTGTETILGPGDWAMPARFDDGYPGAAFHGGMRSEVMAASNDVYRSANDDVWQLVAAGVPVGGTLTDYTPPLNTTIRYRVVAISDIPSAANSAPVEVETTNPRGYVFINAGLGFTELVRLRYNPSRSIDAGRSRVLHQFAGRRFPIEATGRQSRYDLNVSATLLPDTSSVKEIITLANLAGPALYRDPTGVTVTVSMGEPGFDYKAGAPETVSWRFTRVE